MGRDWYWGGRGGGDGGNGRSSRSKRDAKITLSGSSGGGGNGRSSRSKRDAKTPASVSIADKSSSSSNSSSGSNSSLQKNVMKEANSTVSGCMSAVFHLFDFHHLQFPMSSHHHRDSSPRSKADDNGSLSPEIPLPKGVEAPRNSLESTEEASLPSHISKEANLNISMGIQIKTKPTRPKLEAFNVTTESDSPSTKTPTLVARLMGLDLLPDKSLMSSSSSPCSCSSALFIDLGTQNLRSKPHTTLKHYSLHRNSVDGGVTGTRSLPETPRISLGRRSDVEYYQQHRLSLQINRENVSEQEPGAARFASSRLKEMKMKDNKENRSPREYARQIVMQLKENVSRRVGTDITNTTRNKEQTRDHNHDHRDSKKVSKVLTSESSSSPRLRSLENTKTKPTSPKTPHQTNIVQIVETVKVQDKPRLQTVREEPQKEQEQERGRDQREREGQKQRKLAKKCKRTENETKFCLRLVKPPQTMQEEPFVRMPATGIRSSSSGGLHHGDKKCKKTPLSNDLLNFSSTVPSLLPVKKKDPSDHKPSNLYLDALKVTDAQAPRRSNSQLHSCPSLTQRHIVRREITSTISAATTTTTAGTSTAAELDYITRILRRTGIDKDTPISYAKWFSPSHPLDASIFYFLEHFAITSSGRTKNSTENMSLRCNRKLLFHLVDEILVDVLKPHMNMKPWVCHYPIHRRRDYLGSELIDELCLRIGRFPLADCRVLEDIDALVAGDLPETEARRDLAFEEESEGIVTELEKEILETLVSETASDCIIRTETVPFREKVSASRGTFT